jgi:hypothetical protein
MHWYHVALVLLPWALYIISDVMAFMPEGKAKGILHAVYMLLSDAQKVLPPVAGAPVPPKDASQK